MKKDKKKVLINVFEDMLDNLVPDAGREGLANTPERMAKAWLGDWTSGYAQDAAEILTVFEDGAENYDEMIVVKDIPVYSHCEHHLAPFFGSATVAYVPNKRIIGLSKVNRLVDMFMRRLQVQERLTTQIVEAMDTHLQPLGTACKINCRHMCMESRGVRQHGHSTTTVKLTGVFKTKPEARAEFLAL